MPLTERLRCTELNPHWTIDVKSIEISYYFRKEYLEVFETATDNRSKVHIDDPS